MNPLAVRIGSQDVINFRRNYHDLLSEREIIQLAVGRVSL